MPPEQSTPVDAKAEQQGLNEAIADLNINKNAQVEEHEDNDEKEAEEAGDTTSAAKIKKKKSKKKRVKDKLTSIAGSSKQDATPASASSPLPGAAIDALSDDQINTLLSANPALKNSLPKEVVSNPKDLRAMIKKLSAEELMTGISTTKDVKDMAGHSFWSTQPVVGFGDPSAGKVAQEQGKSQGKKEFKEGPIQVVDKDKVPQKPSPLVEGFEWSEINLEDEKQLEEVRDLLCNHYVEDNEAMFRFNYSAKTLNWALKAPGWKREWHVGVRASKSQKLVAFISAVPVTLRVRGNSINGSEVNFLCIHKKLRSKRLAPVLIMEITRRCNLEGIFQAVFTAGVIVSKPVASCRYYHRPLDWEKLYKVGFSPLPPGSTKLRQVAKYKLPNKTSTPGFRPMTMEDADAVTDLMKRYLDRMQLAQEFSKEEVQHWLVDPEADPMSQKRVVWTYVVEENGKVTDFFSFYCIESTVIYASGQQSLIRVAYTFYYGTEAAFKEQKDDRVLRARLNQLVGDVLVVAKKAGFDVLNAVTHLDNPLFLNEQKFGEGDGHLHYYLFNYSTADLASGLGEDDKANENNRGGIGVVML